MITSCVYPAFAYPRKQTIREISLIYELIQDTNKINTLPELDSDWFSILDVLIMRRSVLYIEI